MAPVHDRVDFFTFESGDEELTTSELGTLSLFEGIKKVPSFGKYPGSTVLRKCAPRRVLCNQGESGASAFYILSTEDVLTLRTQQIESLNSLLNGTPLEDEDARDRYSQLSRIEQENLKRELQEEVRGLSLRMQELKSSEQTPRHEELLTVAKVKLFIASDERRPKVGLLQRVAAWFKRPAKFEKKSKEFIPIDSMISLDSRTLEAGLREKEVFGEMSCQDGALRSATVFAEQPCYMLEFLRNILDMLDKDDGYRKKSDEVYRQRVLDKQIRRLSFFEDMTDAEFQDLRPRLDLKRVPAGTIIFDEHEESDCLYFVRRGLVKVVKYTSALFSGDEQKQIDWPALVDEFLEGEASLDSRKTSLLLREEDLFQREIDLQKQVSGSGDGDNSQFQATQDALRSDWEQLKKEQTSLAKLADGSSIASKVWQRLPPRIRSELRQLKTRIVPGQPFGLQPDDLLAKQTVAGLNDFIRSTERWGLTDEFMQQFGDKKLNFITFWSSLDVAGLAENLPDKLKRWSDSDGRLFRRGLLELACPTGLPKRIAHPMQVLNYLGKGEILGEMGFFSGNPRSATCIAFDQRNRGQKSSNPAIRKMDAEASPSRVELVQVKKSDLALLSDNFRRKLELANAKRLEQLREQTPVSSTGSRAIESEVPEFEHLGLVQGQHMMLIDLERCTRCGACVEACVDAHSDSRTRLYLDGPRFDKYLIPVTCRSCLDPVCLIGCPVGSIYRGDNDEIRIQNHCIGCGICTEQCPYGSIHLSKPDATPKLVQLETGHHAPKKANDKAVVCDLCSSTSTGFPSCVHVCPHDAAMRVNAREFFSNNKR